MNSHTGSLLQEFENARFLVAPGHFNFFGGAERQAVLLAKTLTESYGCQVDFLGWGGDGILADEVRGIGCRPVTFPLNIEQRGFGFIRKLWQLARFIRSELKPDYLLPFVGTHCKIIGSIWHRTGARFSWWNQRDEGRLIYGTKREHQLLRSLPAVVSNSIEGRDFLVRTFGLPEGRVKVINNGIVVPPKSEAGCWRRENGISHNDFVFAMIANLSQYKDHTTLLKAFSAVRSSEEGKRCKLVLAGRHAEMTLSLKALAYDLNLNGSVLFPGAMPHAGVQSLLADVDAVVHSSVKEGCPNGALEGMAHGLCVLGTDISGMRQALGEQMAKECLAPAGDAERLGQLMLELVRSPDRRHELGRANRKRIEADFSVGRMTRSVLETVSEFQVA